MDTIIDSVRTKKKLLDALGADQPLMDEVAISTGSLSDKLKEYFDNV